MNFDLTDAQKALRARVSSLCETYCTAELATQRDREGAFPTELHRGMSESGLLAHMLPKPWGAAGTMVDLTILCEAFGATSDAAVNLFFTQMAAGTLIALGGTKDQKAEHLPALARGERRFAFALTEPDAGSDAAAIRCRARREGDAYRLNGTKWFTTMAADADLILAVVRTNDDATAHRGASILAVPTDSAGVRVTPMEKIAGSAIASCEVVFEGVLVPESHRIGAENAAWNTLKLTAGLERLVIAASCVGAGQTIVETARAFALERAQFGKPIAGFQAIQHRLVDMATTVEAMRWMTYHAAWLVDRGRGGIQEVCMAKLFASERLSELALDGMKILGGRAYLKRFSMERHLRESLLSLYAGGTAEIQRNVIAKTMGLR